MKHAKYYTLLATLPLSLVGSTHAAVIASTDFNDSTIGGSTNIKTDLNWVTNGVDDPGDMAAFQFGGAAQSIFNANAFVQDIFMPGLNVGNAGGGENSATRSWTTTLDLTVSSGFSVTLEDVTFNSVSSGGTQTENPDRPNDYTVTLIDPSSNIIEAVTVPDTQAGTSGPNPVDRPLVFFDFADVLLSDPGTYTLQIRGGDFTGADATGNHAGLDNISINGTVNVAAIPEPSSFALLGLGALAALGRRSRR